MRNSFIYVLILVLTPATLLAGHKVKPDKLLWQTKCTDQNIKKLLNVSDFYTETCEPPYEIGEDLANYFMGEKFVAKLGDLGSAQSSLNQGNCVQYRKTSTERLLCKDGVVASFVLEWEGGTDKMWNNLEKKYGQPKKNISLHAWIENDTRMVHGRGEKTKVGIGKIYEQSAERIIFAESDQGTFAVSNKIIFLKPTLFDEIKTSLEKIDGKNKARKKATDDAASSSLPE
jgi:hypothetical protein